ncbi:hypothetical protein E2C01_093763 [Portunus trituberculatus]|uniref:Uncharacterized protein n=1 Tax=Portunus trituberculatus TaxID=210409 RepID=A0A5B7K189_PORTR|nr:hypothetical protein [Portunus trituberculatus]
MVTKGAPPLFRAPAAHYSVPYEKFDPLIPPLKSSGATIVSGRSQRPNGGCGCSSHQPPTPLPPSKPERDLEIATSRRTNRMTRGDGRSSHRRGVARVDVPVLGGVACVLRPAPYDASQVSEWVENEFIYRAIVIACKANSGFNLSASPHSAKTDETSEVLINALGGPAGVVGR